MAIKDIYDAIMDFDETRVADLVNAEIAAGTDVQVILDEGMIAALDIIGQKFSEGTLFVPEMLMAADAVQVGLEILRPLLIDTGAQPVGTVVLGTVKGDLHDIGKNLVGMMLEGAGFRLIDLGTDVDPEDFISTAQENEADIIGLSALLTTSMAEMEKAVAAITTANEARNINVKVMIGGPPVNQTFAEKIGAQGYGEDAPSAVEVARRMVRV
ncbi:MAG: corrinoid protein [Alphaproteobacteria bacterium]|nr:corrinoid protein [Alphaproteobacteria bacterium]